MIRRLVTTLVVAVLALVTRGATVAAQTATDLLTAGMRSYQNLDYEAAAATLRRGLMRATSDTFSTPERLQALTYLGATELFRGRRDSAVAAFRQIAVTDPRYRPSAIIFPPQVTSMFQEVRQGTKTVFIQVPPETEFRARSEHFTARLVASTPHDIAVAVTREDGTVVNSLYTGPIDDSLAVTWDGTERGDPVKSGHYLLRVTSRAAAGARQLVRQLPLEIERARPDTQAWPSPGDAQSRPPSVGPGSRASSRSGPRLPSTSLPGRTPRCATRRSAAWSRCGSKTPRASPRSGCGCAPDRRRCWNRGRNEDLGARRLRPHAGRITARGATAPARHGLRRRRHRAVRRGFGNARRVFQRTDLRRRGRRQSRQPQAGRGLPGGPGAAEQREFGFGGARSRGSTRVPGCAAVAVAPIERGAARARVRDGRRDRALGALAAARPGANCPGVDAAGDVRRAVARPVGQGEPPRGSRPRARRGSRRGAAAARVGVVDAARLPRGRRSARGRESQRVSRGRELRRGDRGALAEPPAACGDYLGSGGAASAWWTKR